MKNKKLVWCSRKKEGIQLIEPNDNLSDKYMAESNQTLESLELIKNKWGLIMGYYASYNALYSILMKIGVKCEIHDCSIELMKLIHGFSEEDISSIEDLKKDRISVQYYLKDKVLEDKSSIKKFILKCKQIRQEIDVQLLRSIISKIIRGEEN